MVERAEPAHRDPATRYADAQVVRALAAVARGGLDAGGNSLEAECEGEQLGRATVEETHLRKRIMHR